jgi:two-component system, LytTR family, sensor kinase
MARTKLLPRVLLHILFWCTYLPLNASLACVIQGATIYDNLGQTLIGESTTLITKMAVVYFIFYYVVPRYLDRVSPAKLFLMIVAAFLVGVIMYRTIDVYLYYGIILRQDGGAIFSEINVPLALFDLFVTTSAALTIKLVRVGYNQLEYEQQLIKEKLSAELDFLRAQTNPHFLFNTLNNLYGLSRKKSDKAPQGIMMLSKILRFMLYDCKAPRIPLINEAKMLQDYIELEKLRYDDRLTVKYEQNLDNSGTLIAPLLLLPFVENSFKHGAHSSTDAAEIRITLNLKKQQLEFLVENTFDEPDASIRPGDDAHGIGISNQRRQLELLYPNRHTFETGSKNGWYRARLTVDLSEEELS